MKKTIIFLFFMITCRFSYSQVYLTRNGFIGFYSKTPLEDIRAENNQVYAVVDVGKMNLAFTTLLKGFIFPKELMQEHFNENYAESDKYPKASFSGSFTGNVDVKKDGQYLVMVKGTLSLHNASKEIEVPATLEVKGGTLSGHAQFKIRPEDFHIDIPSLVRDKIAKEITVTIKVDCNPQ
jgi:polyisoprenoid-binding protein YceI